MTNDRMRTGSEEAQNQTNKQKNEIVEGNQAKHHPKKILIRK